MINIVHELRRARGKNAKLEILKKHSDNFHWLRYLQYVYDDSINYYVSAPAAGHFVHDLDVSAMFESLEALKDGKYKGNAARSFVQDCSYDYGELFRLALKRNINAGVSYGLLDIAYPDLIYQFKVMLAEDQQLSQSNLPAWASIKYDGVRLVIRVESGFVAIYTRSGKLLNLTSLAKQMSVQNDGWYDGELVTGNGKQSDRTKITGYVNKILKGTADDIDVPYKFCIMDIIPLEDWDKRHSVIPYLTRYSELNDNLIIDKNIMIIDQTEVNSLEEINSMFDGLLVAGFEGIILRWPQDTYRWDRSTDLTKKKAIKEGIADCTGINEGSGKYLGLIGSLQCKAILEGKEVRFNVGSGLSSADVEEDPSYFVGKRIEIEYNDIVKSDKNDYYSVFLPRFKRVLGNVDI